MVSKLNTEFYSEHLCLPLPAESGSERFWCNEQAGNDTEKIRSEISKWLTGSCPPGCTVRAAVWECWRTTCTPPFALARASTCYPRSETCTPCISGSWTLWGKKERKRTRVMNHPYALKSFDIWDKTIRTLFPPQGKKTEDGNQLWQGRNIKATRDRNSSRVIGSIYCSN